jgi:hypothetical protein
MAITRSQSGIQRQNERMQQYMRNRRFRKRYRPTDIYHRHRLPDAQHKSVRVISYSRRP